MKNKNKKLLIFILINVTLLLLALGYLLLLDLTEGDSLSMIFMCPTYVLLVVYCPGCGATRAVRSFFSGRFIKSFLYNPAIFLSILLFLAYDVAALIAILKKKDKISLPKPWMYIAIGSVMLLNWLIRNILLLAFGIDIPMSI